MKDKEMATIGKIYEKTENGKTNRAGYISTLDMSLNFKLTENEFSNSPSAPAYIITTAAGNGEAVQIGAVWKKSFEKMGKPPTEFLSLTFDDPSFPHSLNVAAFKGNDPNEWDITWRRRQSNNAA